jgi:hypothetical protein
MELLESESLRPRQARHRVDVELDNCRRHFLLLKMTTMSAKFLANSDKLSANNLRTSRAEYGAKPSCEVREKTSRTNNIV